jgi:hypothetical protein
MQIQMYYVHNFFKAATLYVLWRDSISRPIAPMPSMAGGDETFFFFFYGPPKVPRCVRSFGKVRPLRWAPDHQSEVEDSSFFPR